MLVVPIDWVEPFALASRLREFRGFVFLDSAMQQMEFGRYSFMAADPFLEILAREGAVFVGGQHRRGDPLEILSAELARYRIPTHPDLPPLQGGAIGHFGYDLSVPYKGSAPRNRNRTTNDLHVGLYDLVIAFDHALHQAWIISTGFPDLNEASRHSRAARRAEFFAKIAGTIKEGPAASGLGTPPLRWASNFDGRSYEAAVEKVQEHIRSGDIFQANISQRFQAQLSPAFDRWAFYRHARQVNAATFGAYMELGEICIASCSPERFLRISAEGRVETRPIKGTIRRCDDDPGRDRQLASELAGSSKDRAENVMIVDLLRNDLSRSCIPASVEVEALCVVESYAGLHHLVSIIRGQLSPDSTPLRLLRECFPGGSITGAPKIRAMEIISDIENVSREIYCGAIGYVGFDGSIDTNIAIRTVIFDRTTATFNVGGGITLLSDPTSEYEETLTKANKIFASFEGA